jgi:hypothetical protein
MSTVTAVSCNRNCGGSSSARHHGIIRTMRIRRATSYLARAEAIRRRRDQLDAD